MFSKIKGLKFSFFKYVFQKYFKNPFAIFSSWIVCIVIGGEYRTRFNNSSGGSRETPTNINYKTNASHWTFSNFFQEISNKEYFFFIFVSRLGFRENFKIHYFEKYARLWQLLILIDFQIEIKEFNFSASLIFLYLAFLSRKFWQISS